MLTSILPLYLIPLTRGLDGHIFIWCLPWCVSLEVFALLCYCGFFPLIGVLAFD